MSLGLSIRSKLILLVGVALVTLLLSASSGYWGMQRSRAALDEITGSRMVSVMQLQTMHEAKTALQAIQGNVFMYENDPEAQGKFAQLVAQNRDIWARIDRAVEAYQKLPLGDEEKALWDSAAGDLQIGRDNDQKLMEIVQRLAANRDPDEQSGLFQEYFLAHSVAAPLFLKIESSLRSILDKSVASAEAASSNAADASGRASLALIGITAGALAGLLVLGFIILRAVTQPIRTAIKAASRIADGNLDVAIETRGQDEMAAMLESLASMQAQLRDLVGAIRKHANEIGNTSLQLSGTTERISAATHQQVAATAEMAGVIQQSADSIGRIACHAEDASQMASLAGETSLNGERVIKGVTGEMAAISAAVIATAGKVRELGVSTREISTVVTVIRDIADQTNLLALNAAIEAARAGESGRGFAVVADEVRKLAERTASSTQQIADTIHQIVAATESVVIDMESQVAKVTHGAALASDAGTTVESINRETVRLGATVNDISTTLNGQRRANSRVAESVEQIAQMSRTNGDAIHECAQLAARLKDLSSELRSAVDKFKQS
jgi:methyl-accepting chemotaxis protein